MSEQPARIPEADDPPVRPLPGQWLYVLGFILGTWGLLSAPWGFAPFFAGNWPGGVEWSGAAVWLLVSTAITTVLALLLFIGSIGVKRLRHWGRILLLLFSVLSLLFGIAGLFFYLPYYFGIGGDDQPEVRGVGPFCAMTVWPVYFVYAIAALYALTRPGVKRMFVPGVAPPV